MISTTTIEQFFNREQLYKKKKEMLQNKLRTSKPQIEALFESPELDAKTKEILNFTFKDVIIRSWNKRDEVNQMKEQSLKDNETHIVPLVEHTITSTHQPTIDVYLNNNKVGSLDFEIDLSFQLKGLQLEVSAGEITNITAGTGIAGGTLYCEGIELVKKESEEIEF